VRLLNDGCRTSSPLSAERSGGEHWLPTAAVGTTASEAAAPSGRAAAGGACGGGAHGEMGDEEGCSVLDSEPAAGPMVVQK